MRGKSIATSDLGLMPYQLVRHFQEQVHDSVVTGGAETLILVEHPPVITMGRRGETLGVKNLVATPEYLAERGVEFVQTDRGGDITFHGPGQLVAYPIVRLIDHKLSVGAYVRLLQDSAIATLNDFGVPAFTDEAGIGVWVELPTAHGDNRNRAKICAIGVRVKQGVTLHGLAMNVTTDLSFYELIVPCGIADKPVTSMQHVLGERCPAMSAVKERMLANLSASILRRGKLG